MNFHNNNQVKKNETGNGFGGSGISTVLNRIQLPEKIVMETNVINVFKNRILRRCCLNYLVSN